MQQQLSQFNVLHSRLPDGWKPILHQQFQNVPGVPLVGPLLARSRSMNRAGVPQQKLMTQLIHQPLKPAKVPRCLPADTHIPSRQRTVKLLRLPGVAQTALTILPRFLHYVRNLLKTGMKITSYNHHARLLSSRASGRLAATSLLRSREPTLSCNQLSTFDYSMSGFLEAQLSTLDSQVSGSPVICAERFNHYSRLGKPDPAKSASPGPRLVSVEQGRLCGVYLSIVERQNGN